MANDIQKIEDNHGQIAQNVSGDQIFKPEYMPDLVLKYYDETNLKTTAFLIALLMLATAFIAKDTLSYLPWLFLLILLIFTISFLHHKSIFIYKSKNFFKAGENEYKISDISNFNFKNHGVTFTTPLRKISFIFIFKEDAKNFKHWYDIQTSK